MEIEIGAAMAIGGLIFSAGGAYVLVKNVNSKLAEYERKKDDQARRIGVTEARCSVTEGILIGAGLSSPNADMRKRARTVGHGVPLIPADDGESEKERE